MSLIPVPAERLVAADDFAGRERENKCDECCPVIGCDTCGPCATHPVLDGITCEHLAESED